MLVRKSDFYTYLLPFTYTPRIGQNIYTYILCKPSENPMFTQTVKLRSKIYRVFAKMGNVFQKRFPQGLPYEDSIYSIEFVTICRKYILVSSIGQRTLEIIKMKKETNKKCTRGL